MLTDTSTQASFREQLKAAEALGSTPETQAPVDDTVAETEVRSQLIDDNKEATGRYLYNQ